MITAPKRIDFLEPTIAHAPPPPPKSGIRRYSKDLLKRRLQANRTQPTIAEVAERLEEKYDLLTTFVIMHKKEIEGIIITEMVYAIKHNDTNEQMDARINGRISTLWRIYIQNEEHQIKTKAAEKENRQSFIKTGEYYTALTIGVAR